MSRLKKKRMVKAWDFIWQQIFKNYDASLQTDQLHVKLFKDVEKRRKRLAKASDRMFTRRRELLKMAARKQLDRIFKGEGVEFAEDKPGSN